jgi:hypothetical protein
MPDIPSIPPALTAATAAASSASPALTALQVKIADISQALQNLTHTVQLNATPTASPDSNMLTLSTAFGNVTVSLVQVGVVEQQNLLQQLLNINTGQKQLTLSVQPGSPPTQGVLLVPTAASPPVAPTTTLSTQPVTPGLSFPPVTSGQTLAAVILPSNILSPALVPLTAVPAGNTPPQYQPLSPQIIAATLSNLSPSHTANPAAANPVPAAIPALSSSQPAPLAAPVPSVAENASFVETPVSAAPLTANPIMDAPAMAAPPTSIPNAQPPVSSTTTSPSAITQPATTQTVTAQTTSIQTAPTPTATPQHVATPTILVSTPLIPAANLAVPQSAPALAALLQPGNEVTLKVDAVLPAAPNSVAITTPPLAPNQIAATVVGTGTDGQLILTTADAVLFVKTPVTAPVGTNVMVTVDAVKPSLLMPLPTTPSSLPSLPQAVAAIAQANPLVFQQMMATSMPQLNEALPGALLLLFSAFRQGNVRGWLGEDATDSLVSNGQSNLVNSLSRELGGGQPAQDATVGEWRSYPIPLYAQQQFQAMTLYVHHDRDARQQQSGDSADSNKKLRFLIDMSLSKLGAMQIDGFVQPKKLDMVLRSETLLPDGTHNEMRAAYIKALDAVGYAGTLHFQVGRQHWMTMRQKAAQTAMI